MQKTVSQRVGWKNPAHRASCQRRAPVPLSPRPSGDSTWVSRWSLWRRWSPAPTHVPGHAASLACVGAARGVRVVSVLSHGFADFRCCSVARAACHRWPLARSGGPRREGGGITPGWHVEVDEWGGRTKACVSSTLGIRLQPICPRLVSMAPHGGAQPLRPVSARACCDMDCSFPNALSVSFARSGHEFLSVTCCIDLSHFHSLHCTFLL